MKLTFAGSGDAFGSGGRFHTCFHVETEAQTFLVDCGASSMTALERCAIDRNAIGTIFISHLHGDHFGALPFFLLQAHFNDRREGPLTIAGPPGLEERLLQSQEVLFPGSSKIDWRFALDMVELEAEVERAVNGITVTPFTVRHPSGAPSFALRLETGGRVLTYSGDTEWVDALVPASAGADLFICECYAFGFKPPFHIDHQTLIEKRDRLSAKRIIITHMGPTMLDNLEAVDFEAAFDGMVVDV